MSEKSKGFEFDDELLSNLEKLKHKYSSYEDLDMDIQTNPKEAPESVEYKVQPSENERPDEMANAEYKIKQKRAEQKKYEVQGYVFSVPVDESEPEEETEFAFSDDFNLASEAEDNADFYSLSNDSDEAETYESAESDSDELPVYDEYYDDNDSFFQAEQEEMTDIYSYSQEADVPEYDESSYEEYSDDTSDTSIDPFYSNEPEYIETEIPAKEYNNYVEDDDDDDFAELDDEDDLMVIGGGAKPADAPADKVRQKEKKAKQPKKKAAKSGKKLSQKTLKIIIGIAIPIVIWLTMFITDMILVNRWCSPFFCIETTRYENGGRNYMGIFYKVQFKVDSNGEASGEIIPWGVKGIND